jgi:protein-L-isoaspartate(D-aspartate) O-methyltransferase
MMKPSKRQDTYRHQGLRNQLIRSIQKKGISDPAVLAAMEKVPRHFFFDSSFLEYAYEDQPFPIGAGQTISQPYTVAYQTSLLKLSKDDKVLEIGTGSGYQACILAEICSKVFSIERQKALFDKTRILLTEIGYQRIKLFYGDGYKGLSSFAPFDKVLVTAAAPYIPEPLIAQLKPGGILVIPVGDDVQIMTTIHKITETEIRKEEHGHFRFVPMLENKAKDH